MADYSAGVGSGAAAGAAVGTGVNAGLGTVIGAVIGAGAGLIGSWLQNKFTSSANKKNLNFSREQFDYQKYLNENQFKIMASDAQQVGINPIAMTGGSVQSTQMSAGQQVVDISPAINGIANVGTTIMNNNTQKAINAATNQTSVEVANINAKSAEEIEKTRQEGLNIRHQQQLHSQELIAAESRRLEQTLKDMQISNEQELARKELAFKREQSIVDEKLKDRELTTEQMKIKNDYDLALKQFEEAKKMHKWQKIKEAWQQVLNTWESLSKTLLFGSQAFNNFSGMGSSNPIGFAVN